MQPPPGQNASFPKRHALLLSAWCMVAAFGAYFCMYAFRKPFTAASYTGVTLWGLDYKPVLVTAQVLGYMLSKFIGIRLIAEMRPERRATTILVLITLAEVALLAFGLVPPPYNFICLFCNGLPLGMVFGLVLGFLEGRQQTEILTATLCASFILADGVTKSVGAWLLHTGISEYWMPFAAGLLFLGPQLVFVWMLAGIPAPTAADQATRSARTPMNRTERWQFFLRYGVGLTLLVLGYLFVTILRSIRADFAPEIWAGLQTRINPDIYASSESLVALAVVLLTGMSVLVRDNRRAFFLALALSVAGVGLIPLALLGFNGGWLEPFTFMVLLGLGLYIPYVAVHTTIFERLLAMTRDRGNIGYLMYLADTFGYLGYVAVMLVKNTGGTRGDFLVFFEWINWVLAGAGLVSLALCWLYFAAHPATKGAAVPAAAQV